MSNKITEDTIKKIIEEFLKEQNNLNERVADTSDWGHSSGLYPNNLFDKIKIKGNKLSKKSKEYAKIKAISTLDGSPQAGEPGSTLSTTDLQKAAVSDSIKVPGLNQNKKISIKGAAQDIIKNADPAFWDFDKNPEDIDDPSEFAVGDETEAKKGLGVYEPKSIAFGQMANIGMQDPDTVVGDIQLGIGTAMKEFFKDKTTFIDRINAISQFTKNIFIDGNLPTDKRSLLRASLVTDYLTTIVNEIDSGSGAYQFETFLAAIAGGRVIGKTDVDSSGGTKASSKMGAVDFQTADGSFGSSKYYSSTSGLSQAFSGFDDKKNKTTLYIIAIKKSLSGITGASGSGEATTSDPGKIMALDIYMVSVKPKVDNPRSGSDFAVKINGLSQGEGAETTGGALKIAATTKGSETFSIAKATPIKLYMATEGGQSLKQKLVDLTQDDTKDLNNAYRAFDQLFKNLYDANQNAQAYASSGDKDQGNKALSTLATSDEQLINLVKLITKDTKDTFDASARKINEQKITSNFLKKLIEETLKK